MNREKIWSQNVNVTQLIFSFVFQSPPDFFLLLKIWRRSVNDIRRGSRTILPLDVQFNASGTSPCYLTTTVGLTGAWKFSSAWFRNECCKQKRFHDYFWVFRRCFLYLRRSDCILLRLSLKSVVNFFVANFSKNFTNFNIRTFFFSKNIPNAQKKGLTRNSLLGVSSIG